MNSPPRCECGTCRGNREPYCPAHRYRWEYAQDEQAAHEALDALGAPRVAGPPPGDMILSVAGRILGLRLAPLTFEDAMKRLAGCRKLQPTEMQVIVSADIVDALIASHDTRFSEVQTGPENARRLGKALADERARRGIGLRQAALETGVSFNTLSRIERGADCRYSHALVILAWLAEAPRDATSSR